MVLKRETFLAIAAGSMITGASIDMSQMLVEKKPAFSPGQAMVSVSYFGNAHPQLSNEAQLAILEMEFAEMFPEEIADFMHNNTSPPDDWESED